MINSQLNHFSSSFVDEDVNFRDYKIDMINFSPTERKPSRNNNKSISTPGSNSSSSINSNTDAKNGVYVDAGKILLEAAKTGDTEKVHDCIKNGAPFITDWLGTSALHIAAKNNFYETCATLLRAGISKDAKTKVDRTPLHFAVFEGNFEICQLLLQHECSVDPLDMLRMSPLHWAVDKNYDNIAELLLEFGANPHLVSKFLKTPYSIAKDKNNDFIVNIMENLPGNYTGEKPKLKCQLNSSLSDHMRNLQSEINSRKRGDKTPNIDSSAEVKRMKPSMSEDTSNLTLEMLKDQMTSMMSHSDDNNMMQSVLQSGRKLTLTEAGKRLLNDSNLNKILKNPLSVPKKSTPATVTSESSSNVLEIFRESSKSKDLLNLLRSASTSDFQEVTITQCSKLSPTTSPTQKSSGVNCLSAINVPKVRKTSTVEKNNVTEDANQPESMQKKFSELTTNYQLLKRQFEREQQKTSSLQRQLKQLETNYENYKRQQHEKFEIIFSMIGANFKNKDNNSEEVEEVL